MSDLGFAIFNTGINALETFLYAWFATKYLGFRKSMIHKKCAFITIWVILFMQLQVVNSLVTGFEGVLVFITSILVCIYAFAVLQGKWLEKIFISFVPLMCVAIINTCVGIMQGIIWKESVSEMIAARRFEYIVLVIITKVLLIMAFLCILKLKKTMKELKENKLWLLFVIIVITSIVSLIFIYFTVLFIYNDKTYLYYLLCAAAGILIMNIITFYFLKRISKENELKKEIELLKQNTLYQQENIRNILQEQENIRKIRHDMKSVILAIQGLAKQENSDEIYACCTEYIGELGQDNSTVYTGIHTIDNLLSYKFGIAESQGNRVKAEISALKMEKINDIHMCVILGNLLDNAMEALQTVSNADKCIWISMEQEKESYINIFVKNTMEASVLQNNPQLLTTKVEKGLHGFGIRNVKELVRQYEGIINFYEEGNMFVCHIQI